MRFVPSNTVEPTYADSMSCWYNIPSLSGQNQQNPLIPFGCYFRQNETKIIR